MYAITAIVAAVENSGRNLSDSKSLGFAGIWAMILMIGLSVGGTLVMRKFQTPLAVGFFIGVVIMMSFQMFSLTVLFVGESYLAKEERTLFNKTDTNIHTNEAAAVFSFFMFTLYVRDTLLQSHPPQSNTISLGNFRRCSRQTSKYCHQRSTFNHRKIATNYLGFSTSFS